MKHVIKQRQQQQDERFPPQLSCVYTKEGKRLSFYVCLQSRLFSKGEKPRFPKIVFAEKIINCFSEMVQKDIEQKICSVNKMT